MIVYEKPAEYRGTIEVYADEVADLNYEDEFVAVTEWRWQCKSRNGNLLGRGKGYKRRAGALNAVDAQYSVQLAEKVNTDFYTPELIRRLVVPWRLVIHDRHGNIERIGAVY
ncbi:hypothetical protein SEA_CLARK_57 [Gordonia phage Clark]|uniref:DUF1508 domain-containing protein n=3 Tax=Beenievirus TaxID=3044673 RepID=A0A5P8DBQ7_9CAUD|nr:hypothetical protein PP506_gp50 [Gordonia phage DobbysSock]YP_010654452.1 hypothetical protein PP507_gp57 [Gordonia phage Clark]YP_010654531.1 hypothetical protein PP508_gp58 [Gordonia phage Samman98]QDF18006.1 hypothetical protein SEA_CLARK_57 [Gordonia phage Clark]QFP96171.1 hypothetical protein DOBBYSSOCK_SEA_50 [Gordonia phage DobbysSock]QYC54536.1 hypothetical protein SEA_SAMMAN98_58 [Gordonia phage Samman98]